MKAVHRLPASIALTCLAGAAALGISGCSMCSGPYDYDYPAFPGVIQRADPVFGRVGSIFSDPYKAGSGPSADSNLKPTVRKEAPELEDLDAIPEALPDSQLNPPPSAPQEPMKIDRETRNPFRSAPTPLR
jgi:hypothetical protein